MYLQHLPPVNSLASIHFNLLRLKYIIFVQINSGRILKKIKDISTKFEENPQQILNEFEQL